MIRTAIALAISSAGSGTALAASSDECAILSEVVRKELIRREDGSTPLPAPEPMKAQSSRAKRHAAYAKRLEEANAKPDPNPLSKPFDIDTLQSWVGRDAAMLEGIAPEMPAAERADLVARYGAARPAFSASCDWKKADIAFKPDPTQPNQWLTIGKPVLSKSHRFALVALSYGYTPTFARESLCVVEKKAEGWSLRKCGTLLGS
ncbi:hypothetical protein [Allosphingosinicella vermicomposti]|uniref:hypothetical protein n=1 Tax=Allosphingosinicella vermicomposti TaxID=614671 RepID=UPI00131A4BE5|nr:hypothetical protein [Allosphingosinicella vermicomposti]